LQIDIDFRDNQGVNIGNLVYGNISEQIPAYTTKTLISKSTDTDMSKATYCVIKIQGKDNANASGFYGPRILNIYLTDENVLTPIQQY
jgi:hypothetical protein